MPVLEDTLRKYLMDPPAPGPVTVIMVPDEAWAEEERLREDTDLAALDASLTDADLDDIAARSRTLLAEQRSEYEGKEATENVLPCLSIADIPRSVPQAKGRYVARVPSGANTLVAGAESSESSHRRGVWFDDGT